MRAPKLLLASILTLAIATAGCGSTDNDNPATPSSSSRSFGALPGGTQISGAPSEEELEALRASSDEQVIDDLRGKTLADALSRLGPLDKIHRVTKSPGDSEYYDASPVVLAAPIAYQGAPTEVTTLPKDKLTVTSALAVGPRFYFGVMPTSDISNVPDMREMLAQRAPMTATQSKHFSTWLASRNDLVRQAKIGGVDPSLWVDSVVIPPR
ncbi:hypothetical protein [Tsukamurella pulmonis]|uniref:hypothetical protein n=1 Tax=Tsukamurella pulmonis TaxID=47312 RepID=UPI001112A368|nr:hypothetical protein [Tsukamurella pulmonis]